MNQAIKLPYIFVLGNEKGGAGKTTCSMHLIVSLLEHGFKVASIDVDCRQHSLTSYLKNRDIYNNKNLDKQVKVPLHFHINDCNITDAEEKKQKETELFLDALAQAKELVDIIVVDTPGSCTHLSKLAHSHADTIITPINDSFVDIDVMAKINCDNLEIVSPSIYSQMIWEQKMQRAQRDRGSIEWVVLRNRLNALDAINKRNITTVLDNLAKRISFRQIPGFNERVIFRELFLTGLTLLDLKHANFEKSFSISHVAARQELRNFLKALGVDSLLSAKGYESAEV